MNIIETLVKPALSFGLSKALQRLRRLQTSYQAAFANPEVEPRVVELAIRDIKAVFGRAGFLDEPLVQLLDELARAADL